MRRLIIFALLMVLSLPLLGRSVRAEDAGLSTRVDGYSASFPVQISDQEHDSIVQNCGGAQTKLSGLLLNISAQKTTYLGTFALSDTRLSAIQKRIGHQQIDTSTIDLLVANYRKQIQQFEKDFDNYQQALSDASLVDCVNSPEGFLSTLGAVRQYRGQLEVDSQKISQYVNKNVVEAFVTIKSNLEGVK